MVKFLCVNCALFWATVFAIQGRISIGLRTPDGSEEWGYVEVRPKAHMFWWLYRSPYRVEDPNKPWPTILWLQGGPGGSGTGIGNFEEIGPFDSSLRSRNSTWLKIADLLFVDNPVGTGYSYVEEDDKVVKSDEEAGADLTVLLINIFNNNNKNKNKNKIIYIVAESYGGKFAVTLALSALHAIDSGLLNLTLGGVVLGDTWISPEDFVLAWGPLLKDVSRLDTNGLQRANRIAQEIKQLIGEGKYENAIEAWIRLENEVIVSSNFVDFYNFLLDAELDPLATSAPGGVISEKEKLEMRKYRRYLSSKRKKSTKENDNNNNEDPLDTLMNGPIRNKLQIIPDHVSWGGQSGLVFSALKGDFMKPRIREVDELLAKGINVTIYNGQLDVICATMGTEAWVSKLNWEGMKTFQEMGRTALYCEDEKGTKGFTKSFQNLHFYWVLHAGHFVPVDEPCVALKMMRNITDSPSLSS